MQGADTPQLRPPARARCRADVLALGDSLWRMSDLTRPDGLGDNEWAALEEGANRLERARAASDYPLGIGCAKDLCEAVARVAINERGGVAPGADMTDLVHTAH